MIRGVVKWFEDPKGYGFIRCDGLGEDIMVHYSDIVMDGHKTLESGDSVDFQVKRGDKGLKAVNVVLVPKVETTPTPSTPPA